VSAVSRRALAGVESLAATSWLTVDRADLQGRRPIDAMRDGYAPAVAVLAADFTAPAA